MPSFTSTCGPVVRSNVLNEQVRFILRSRIPLLWHQFNEKRAPSLAATPIPSVISCENRPVLLSYGNVPGTVARLISFFFLFFRG